MTAYDQDVLFKTLGERHRRETVTEGPTLTDHIDQLLMQRSQETREARAVADRARADASALEDENDELRAKLQRRRRFDASLAVLTLLVLGACAVFR